MELGLDMLREALRSGRSIDMQAFGFSMWPRIKDSTMVHVEPCSGATVSRGDVVLFERTDRFVLHRVLRTSGDQLWVKGDACLNADGWVPHDKVLGRVPRRLGDGLMARFAPVLSRPLGLASIVARRVGGLASKF